MKCIILAVLLSGVAALAQDSGGPRGVKGTLKLEKGAVLHTPLVIEADGVVIEGNGAVIEGPGKAGDLKSFVGAGVSAKGRSKVTIRNLVVRGFESALVAEDGQGWTIEGCDFSGNYHDLDYGWGDYQRVGGIILTGMHGCAIRNNKANNVWNALDLWECDKNTIEKNDFSHCSNVCLKMWTASGNRVIENNLSYGIRIAPGEVHARDSTSVLMESGSNDNHYERNDITHGGDGVFIRVLNGWCSTGNVFIENDCSHANNNGFEAWSPDNTYIRNKANHCSYGFWLGGSDHTVLIGNEAGYNGQPDGPHNAPEPDFQHGGIVIVGGSGSHTLIEGNWCHHNAGAGIVFRGDLGTKGAKWRMHHLIVQNNRLEHNKWGLFARFTDWLDLAGNTFTGNEKDEFLEEVTNLTRREAGPRAKSPKVVMAGPSRVKVGEQVVFDASASSDPAAGKLQFRWDLGDGSESTQAKVEHAYAKPGYYRVGVTGHNGQLAGLAFRDLYVYAPVDEQFSEGQAGQWGFSMGSDPEKRGRVRYADDATHVMVGSKSLSIRPDPYMGEDVTFFFPKNRKAGLDLSKRQSLNFWVKFQNPNNGGFQGPNPIVRLHSGKAAYSYTPAYKGMPRNLMGDLPYSEARHGWLYVSMPLAGGDDWLRNTTWEGQRPPHVAGGLNFQTLTTPIETQSASSMTTDGQALYCAAIDGDRLWKSADGKAWTELPRPEGLKASGSAWINGMLAYHQGRLILRYQSPQRDEKGQEPNRLAALDLASGTWSWLPTSTAMSNGTTVVGDWLFGLAHAVGGNYGGPLCRVNLAQPGPVDEHSVPGPPPGKDAWWFSRAAQLATLDGKVYAIKNDWQTPQPTDPKEIGDRLMMFDPAAYKPSAFAGGHLWNDKAWKEARTPITDLGPLPFEIGHGAALVALPANWSKAVGSKGGLFIIAGCSPSNHEGYGPPSSSFAVYDLASGKFTVGELPEATGTGTSAAMLNGTLYIKRGGMNYGPSNAELWTVRPLSADQLRGAEQSRNKQQVDLSKVDSVSLQFDSLGNDPFTLWLDGIYFE